MSDPGSPVLQRPGCNVTFAEGKRGSVRQSQQSLKGIVAEIEEVTFWEKDTRPNAIVYRSEEDVVDSDDLPHDVVRISLKNRARYAMDIAITQYG